MADAEHLIASMTLPFPSGRPGILSLVRAAAAVATGTGSRLDLELPQDEDRENETEERIRFVPGGLDALFGRPDRSAKQTKARTLVAALSKFLRHPSPEALTARYGLLRQTDVTSIVDETLERISSELPQRRGALAALARRLVAEAPDVDVVKMGLALLGISGVADDEALILEIGRHDEFSLFSAVALSNLLDNSEDAIWRLAQSVHGWGRIAAVERLADTRDPRIKSWLLREGFRNDIMFEYLAYIAATRGELLNALHVPDIDDGLLLSAAQILSALIAGGPAEGIEDYRDGPAACEAFLRHALLRDAPSLPIVSTVSAIKQLTTGDSAERLKTLPGWSAQVFLTIRTRTGTFMQRPGARASVEAGLTSEEPWGDHFVAAQLAPEFGIDPWPSHLARQRRKIGDNWWHLMQTKDPNRVEQVLSLAREQLDLALVGSGPTSSLGLDLQYKDDQAVDFIVQDLKRFPGVGADFVDVGLRGRTTRLRNMAINALRDWGRDRWPAGAADWVAGALSREPDEDLRKRLELLLANKLAD